MEQLSNEVMTMPDDVLARAAWQQRREALHGNRHSFGRAHVLEQELRRRSGYGDTSHSRVGGSNVDPKTRSWWQFWRP